MVFKYTLVLQNSCGNVSLPFWIASKHEWMNAELIHSDDCSLGQNMITAYWMPPDWDHLKTL